MDLHTAIGVVGMGVVGRAVYRGFASFCSAYGYDIDSARSVHGLGDVLAADVVFLCLPTPQSATGAADLAAVHLALAEIVAHPAYTARKTKPALVLKSTVPVGTTSALETQYGVSLVHCPEFLSARTAEIDFLTSTRILVGANCPVTGQRVVDLFEQRFPGVHLLRCRPEESEFVKYFLNSLYATKITFFNEMRLLSDALQLGWENVLRGVLSSGWVEQMHTSVPGPDGKFGFGGACFPKDTQALANMFREHAIECLVLDAVIKQNARVRARSQP